jgi:hypothetical protein
MLDARSSWSGTRLELIGVGVTSTDDNDNDNDDNNDNGSKIQVRGKLRVEEMVGDVNELQLNTNTLEVRDCALKSARVVVAAPISKVSITGGLLGNVDELVVGGRLAVRGWHADSFQLGKMHVADGGRLVVAGKTANALRVSAGNIEIAQRGCVEASAAAVLLQTTRGDMRVRGTISGRQLKLQTPTNAKLDLLARSDVTGSALRLSGGVCSLAGSLKAASVACDVSTLTLTEQTHINLGGIKVFFVVAVIVVVRLCDICFRCVQSKKGVTSAATSTWNVANAITLKGRAKLGKGASLFIKAGGDVSGTGWHVTSELADALTIACHAVADDETAGNPDDNATTTARLVLDEATQISGSFSYAASRSGVARLEFRGDEVEMNARCTAFVAAPTADDVRLAHDDRHSEQQRRVVARLAAERSIGASPLLSALDLCLPTKLLDNNQLSTTTTTTMTTPTVSSSIDASQRKAFAEAALEAPANRCRLGAAIASCRAMTVLDVTLYVPQVATPKRTAWDKANDVGTAIERFGERFNRRMQRSLISSDECKRCALAPLCQMLTTRCSDVAPKVGVSFKVESTVGNADVSATLRGFNVVQLSAKARLTASWRTDISAESVVIKRARSLLLSGRCILAGPFVVKSSVLTAMLAGDWRAQSMDIKPSYALMTTGERCCCCCCCCCIFSV